MTIAIIVLCFCVWFFIGTFIMYSIDDEKQSLFNWAINCPMFLGYELFIILWPILLVYVLYFKIKNKIKKM